MPFEPKIKDCGRLGLPVENIIQKQEIIAAEIVSDINRYGLSDEKIKLFMSLFRGRTDVYAKLHAAYFCALICIWNSYAHAFFTICLPCTKPCRTRYISLFLMRLRDYMIFHCSTEVVLLEKIRWK
jgi:hypothetical protein